MNLRSIREALAGVAQGFGFTAYSVLVENPSPPAVVVGLPDVEYGISLRMSKISIAIIILVNRDDMESSQTVLDAAMSTRASSLVDAYNDAADSSFKSCRVVGAGNFRTVSIGNASALACDIDLELTAT